MRAAVLRRLILWMLLLALPMQTHAAATMRHCGGLQAAIPALGMAAADPGHHGSDHDAGLGSPPAHAAADSANHDTPRCPACDTCCSGGPAAPALSLPGLPLPMALRAPQSDPLQLFTSVVLDRLRRPPRLV